MYDLRKLIYLSVTSFTLLLAIAACDSDGPGTNVDGGHDASIDSDVESDVDLDVDLDFAGDDADVPADGDGIADEDARVDADGDGDDADDSGDDADVPEEGPLAALFDERAHFQVDQTAVPVEGSEGHREAFAVNRTDISPTTVYLYHRCFGYAPEASICLSTSSDGADTFDSFHGEVIGPEEGHIFSVAPSVIQYDDTWYMVYEESHVSTVYWAESADGISWTRRGELLAHGGAGEWDQGAVATPGAMVGRDGNIYIFYAGFPLGGRQMSIGVASGTTMETLTKHPDNPIFSFSGIGWDGGHVSMARPIQEGSWTYLVYEGADTDFTCEASNTYGWGMARSRDLVTWERHPGNPFGLSTGPAGCGNDMPSVYRRGWDNVYFVYHTSGDTRHIVREFLALD